MGLVLVDLLPVPHEEPCVEPQTPVSPDTPSIWNHWKSYHNDDLRYPTQSRYDPAVDELENLVELA